MKNLLAWLPAAMLIILVTACGNHTKPTSDTPSGDTTQKPQAGDSTNSAYFPVADWFKGEIAFVDSTPLAIFKYNIANNHTDSALIQQPEFDRLASAFLVPQLRPDSLQNGFIENSFMDKTTGYLTFTYSAKNKDLSLQRVDILAIPGASANRIKSAYVETIDAAGDTVFSKKMFWTARNNFVIIDTRQPKGKPAIVRQLKVVWNHDSN